MTKLLVSVRNVAEARAALAGGADLIDVKEPGRGALGAADPGVIAEIVAAVTCRRSTSVALGEVMERNTLDADRPLPDFAKFGLARCGPLNDWRTVWRQAIERLPRGVAAVAVAYADPRAHAPPFQEILAAARGARCAALLVDTYDKTAGTLLDHWPLREIAAAIDSARAAGMLSVVAGGLTFDASQRIAALGPDYIGVRGAVCQAGRIGSLDAERVRQLAAIVRGEAGEKFSAPSAVSTNLSESL